ncbi:hypothetical protein BFV94_2365 [Alteromonas macleodii]|uniref:Uncharacterized protein n=1 Tax=Alteromonas macleodii TaxID=28108 RepID=A0AB36FQP6_ALTMA|nr:hypothetical protein BFV93_2360 [Alteromonas macleodii]OES31240.1 hypothetical protein BFV95_2366 [Alteromonas macleodii]OES31628.1 hypothetical protein BFV94_2365 [Alteromonas macleodii]OES41008.1 hypothetical protein BFV96_2351 [Alteromonas macleodii]
MPVIYVVKVALCALINLAKPLKWVEPKMRCFLSACTLYARHFLAHWPFTGLCEN